MYCLVGLALKYLFFWVWPSNMFLFCGGGFENHRSSERLALKKPLFGGAGIDAYGCFVGLAWDLICVMWGWDFHALCCPPPL